MKMVVFWFFSTFLSHACASKVTVHFLYEGGCVRGYDTVSKRWVYLQVDHFPEYLGYEDIGGYIITRLRSYSKSELIPVRGTLKVGFIVERDGSISYPRIIGRKDVELTPMERDILCIIASMPKWKPARCKGRKVAFLMQILVHINYR